VLDIFLEVRDKDVEFDFTRITLEIPLESCKSAIWISEPQMANGSTGRCTLIDDDICDTRADLKISQFH
jgi:hypothetical protein